jgi:hypothetical protein
VQFVFVFVAGTASPAVLGNGLGLGSSTAKLDEDNPKNAGLAQENGFGHGWGKGAVKLCTCRKTNCCSVLLIGPS